MKIKLGDNLSIEKPAFVDHCYVSQHSYIYFDGLRFRSLKNGTRNLKKKYKNKKNLNGKGFLTQEMKF